MTGSDTAEKTMPRQAPEWMRRRERGSLFWMQVMCRFSLWVGRRLSRLIVYCAALYFVLVLTDARRASREYLGRVLERPVRWTDIYRHFLTFATTIHDRIYLLHDADTRFDLTWHGHEALLEAYARQGGLLLFGAHLGSFEAMRTLARLNPAVRVCLAMFPDNARQINRMLQAVSSEAMQDVIPLGQLDAMLCMHQKLQEGAMVGILADRSVGKDEGVSMPFLGDIAHFPLGPFRMAAMLRQPVFFMTGLYLGGNRYDIHFELLADFSQTRRDERDAAVRTAMHAYVAILEAQVRAQPFNWFNFFDFWESAEHGKN